MAALCWRPADGNALEILLITSFNSKRWILPKGWLMEGLTPAESAAREALEEAGVTGNSGQQPLGRYHYLKERKTAAACPAASMSSGWKSPARWMTGRKRARAKSPG